MIHACPSINRFNTLNNSISSIAETGNCNIHQSDCENKYKRPGFLERPGLSLVVMGFAKPPKEL